MNISICAATAMELSLFQKLAPTALTDPRRHCIHYCVTGIGMLQSSFYLQQHIQNRPVDFLLQIGIAGCFNSAVPLASVWILEREYLGSLGVVEKPGPLKKSRAEAEYWQDIFDLGLQEPDHVPFSNKALINNHIQQLHSLKDLGIGLATGITIDEITTSPSRIETLRASYINPDEPMRPLLESMEGASLHFNALQYQIPFLQLRGVSNYTGQRDKAHWDIGGAVKAVTGAALNLMNLL